MHRRFRTGLQTGLLVLLLAGCAAPEPLRLDPQALTPEQWATPNPEVLPELPGWLDELADPRLHQLVAEALAQNPELAAAREQVEQTRLALRISAADRLPVLSLSLNDERSESTDNSLSLATELSWDADLWGELAAEERRAELEYASAQADLRRQVQTLAADVSRTWFQLQEAQLLLELYQRRSDNLQGNLATLESGYRQGLYEALDLYLARNDVHAQQAVVAQQAQTLAETRRALELLLGRYPEGRLLSSARLPLIDRPPAALLPARMVERRPDLQASWLGLLAADQALAAAYRARFPDFSLSASHGGSSDTLSALVSSGNLAWTLGASLTQTLFDGGQLRAAQQQQAARRRELEQSHLAALQAAFAEVENALSDGAALRQQHERYLAAQENAIQAEQLAFERYQRGLEEFTTVLEAQRRSLDAQSNVIELRRALLENRIDLALALGGPFASAQPPSETTETLAR